MEELGTHQELEALRRSELEFRTAFAAAPIGLAIVSTENRVLKVNRVVCDILGYTEGELVGASMQAVMHSDDAVAQQAFGERLLRGEVDAYRFEGRLHHKMGRIVWCEVSVAAVRDTAGQVSHVIWQAQDITERRRAEQELVHMANFDALTEVFNRRRFREEVEKQVLEAVRYGQRGALIFIDLDQFKQINDTAGHQVGDALLQRVARVLRQRLRRTDTFGRLGGDEFAVYLPHADVVHAQKVAASILSGIRQQVEVADGRAFGLTASVGIALFPEHGRTVDMLLSQADLAMYEAKENGRNGVCVFNPTAAAQQESPGKADRDQRVLESLDHNHFVLHCQPVLHLKSAAVSRYELLLRAVGDGGELFYPDTILEVAERYGISNRIDAWVVKQAVHLVAEQQRAGHERTFEVNLTSRSLGDSALVAMLEQEMAACGARGSGLLFEVPLPAALADRRKTAAFAARVQELGCRFALDDFGTDFSIFADMGGVAADCLKIDGSLVENLGRDPVAQHLVRAVVELARGRGQQTVAELVSDAESLALLKDMGVDYAQGFYIGRPGPLAQFLGKAYRAFSS